MSGPQTNHPREAPSAIRCLLVDDDAEIRVNVAALLTGYGMVTTATASATAMKQAMALNPVDVIILDVMLPDGNGLELCRWIHENSNAAVIMLTAQGDPTSRIVGLQLGADDYLGKPFEPLELVARINAVLRRSRVLTERRQEKSQVALGGWTFDRIGRQLESPDGVVLPLSNAEFRMLQAFVDHPRRLLTRDQLMELTRAPGVDVSDRTIDLTISRLRTKLKGDARDLIKTIRGEGYLFDLKG